MHVTPTKVEQNEWQIYVYQVRSALDSSTPRSLFLTRVLELHFHLVLLLQDPQLEPLKLLGVVLVVGVAKEPFILQGKRFIHEMFRVIPDKCFLPLTLGDCFDAHFSNCSVLRNLDQEVLSNLQLKFSPE